MVTGMEDAQFRFMQSLLTEIKIMNDHLMDIKKELAFKNDMEYSETRQPQKTPKEITEELAKTL